MTAVPNASPTPVFPLLEDLIVVTDAFMRSQHAPQKIVPDLMKGVRDVLTVCGALPPELLRNDGAGYLRRELYRSREYGYQIMALTWGPGHHSGIHDHADTWGVEAVLRGELSVVDYRLAKRSRALVGLRPVEQHSLREGDIIGLLPPHHLHSCRNASARQTAVSLHVYGTPLDNVHRYAHVEDDLYRPERVRLSGI